MAGFPQCCHHAPKKSFYWEPVSLTVAQQVYPERSEVQPQRTKTITRRYTGTDALIVSVLDSLTRKLKLDRVLFGRKNYLNLQLSDYIGYIPSSPRLPRSKLLFSMQALYLINTFILGTCNYEFAISSLLSPPVLNISFLP